MTSEQLLIAAVSALAAAVVFLFGLVLKKNATQDKQLDECNKDRDRLNSEIVGIWKSLANAGIKPAIRGTPQT